MFVATDKALLTLKRNPDCSITIVGQAKDGDDLSIAV